MKTLKQPWAIPPIPFDLYERRGCKPCTNCWKATIPHVQQWFWFLTSWYVNCHRLSMLSMLMAAAAVASPTPPPPRLEWHFSLVLDRRWPRLVGSPGTAKMHAIQKLVSRPVIFPWRTPNRNKALILLSLYFWGGYTWGRLTGHTDWTQRMRNYQVIYNLATLQVSIKTFIGIRETFPVKDT